MDQLIRPNKLMIYELILNKYNKIEISTKVVSNTSNFLD